MPANCDRSIDPLILLLCCLRWRSTHWWSVRLPCIVTTAYDKHPSLQRCNLEPTCKANVSQPHRRWTRHCRCQRRREILTYSDIHFTTYQHTALKLSSVRRLPHQKRDPGKYYKKRRDSYVGKKRETVLGKHVLSRLA
jgi:hypothetical protein